MADRVGQQLGNYRLTRLLGQGGFAEVYLGEHVYLKSRAAVKVLHAQLSEQQAANFVQEAQMLARLSHPHIVRVLDFAVQDGIPFLVIEYAPYGTIRHRYAKGARLPLATIVLYVQQVAAALQYAHDQHLIHRDVKPENLLLNERSDILLSDFGLGMFARDTLSQSIQEMAGTAFYMAPEQIQGKPRPASDQYALGIVVYEWLTGDRPFRGSLTEVVTQHLVTPPPSLRERVPTLSPILEEVVLRALAKEPKQRFASIQDFATALQHAAQGTTSPPSTLPSTPAPRAEPTDPLATLPAAVVQERSSAEGSNLPTLVPLTKGQGAQEILQKGAQAGQVWQEPLLDVLHQQQEQVAASSSSPEDRAHLLEGHPASPATAETEEASSLVTQQPAAPTRPEPLWKVPSTLTSLVGREQEVAEISALLKQPEMRLVTLVGPGGIGKTRLSIAVATELRASFTTGVCFVGLASISDPQLVIPSIAQELGLKESGARSLLEQMQAFVGEQSFLLLLDNFEQVVAAAPKIEELLASCPNLKILVTSRAVLHLSAEQLVPVVPLALPDLTKDLAPESIAQSTAVTLFVQRARSQLPSFQLTTANARAIAEVCVRLDGLPLAIELAAARIRLLPPQTLLTHLSQRLQVLTSGSRDAPARQQTLRSTLQWSYDLLGPEEQALFRLLSVFVGGWTLEAAETLTQGTGQANLDVLNTLSALLDSSLIQQSEQEAEQPRFQMLQTVREYGLELLEATGERGATQAVHAHYFLALAEQAKPELEGPKQMEWVARLEQEHDNLRVALEEVAEEQARARREVAWRLSAALGAFWHIHGHYREGRTFLERTLTQSEGAALPCAPKSWERPQLLRICKATLMGQRCWLGKAWPWAENWGTHVASPTPSSCLETSPGRRARRSRPLRSLRRV